MLNQYDHANKLRQSCENMQKCREAAKKAAKRKRNRDMIDAEPSVNPSATLAPRAKRHPQRRAYLLSSSAAGFL
jgi:hypothetical protein